MGDKMEKYKLSKEEKNVINIMWNINHEITPTQILNEIEKIYHKKLAKQTISTVLNRMMKKGVVTAYQKGRNRYYSAISTEEYEKLKARAILDTMYNGSIKNFFIALYCDKSNMNKNDLNELKEWFLNIKK